jgi:hypothetical protein
MTSFVVLDGIEALLRTIQPVLLEREDEPGVPIQLLDGPEFQWPDAEFVAVGLTSGDLELDELRRPVGLESTNDEADILCLIRITTGDGDTATPRRRAYAQLSAIADAIERDRTLGYLTDRDGPQVGNAEITRSIYAPQPTQRGRCVDVIFTVHVKNF